MYEMPNVIYTYDENCLDDEFEQKYTTEDFYEDFI